MDAVCGIGVELGEGLQIALRMPRRNARGMDGSRAVDAPAGKSPRGTAERGEPE